MNRKKIDSKIKADFQAQDTWKKTRSVLKEFTVAYAIKKHYKIDNAKFVIISKKNGLWRFTEVIFKNS
jgi:hypothetical protein